MTTLVTGAAGFVGSALLRRLVRDSSRPGRIIATDLAFPDTDRLQGVDYIAGAIDDDAHLRRITDQPLERVFHLATVAGVQASNFQLGKRVNLTASLALLDRLAEQPTPARLVYSSSVGVFGKPFPAVVDDNTLPSPGWSYGAHKLVVEILITDYARAGLVDGLALRFPGIVARPEGSATMLSAFLNNVFYAAREGRPFKLPLAPQDGTWLMSLRRCLDNVLHAAEVPKDGLPAQRACTLPALFVTMEQLVEALAEAYGSAVKQSITYEPVENAQQLFAMTPLAADRARALGMVGDPTPIDLVRNVIAENQQLVPRT